MRLLIALIFCDPGIGGGPTPNGERRHRAGGNTIFLSHEVFVAGKLIVHCPCSDRLGVWQGGIDPRADQFTKFVLQKETKQNTPQQQIYFLS